MAQRAASTLVPRSSSHWNSPKVAMRMSPSTSTTGASIRPVRASENTSVYGRPARVSFCSKQSLGSSRPKYENEKNHLDGNVAHRGLDSDLQECLDFPGFNRLGFGRGWTRGASVRRYCCRGCCLAQYRGTFWKKGRESGRRVSQRTGKTGWPQQIVAEGCVRLLRYFSSRRLGGSPNAHCCPRIIGRSWVRFREPALSRMALA
jgi:hypothetical protein